MEFRQRIANRAGAVPGLLAALEAAAPGAPRALTLRLCLLVEEVALNAILHGYPDGRAGWIELRAAWTADGFRAEIEDDGDAFDPLSAPPPPRDGPRLDRPAGGAGLLILRRYAGGLSWTRRAGCNLLTFTLGDR